MQRGIPDETEGRDGIVAGLLGQVAVVDAAPVDARRRTGLQAIDDEGTVAQPFRQPRRRRVAGAAAGVVRQADVDLAGKEGARRQHDGRRVETQAGVRHDAAHAIVLDDDVVDGLLEQAQVRLRFDHAPDRRLVQHTVGLGARRAHGRPFRRVQGAPLDAGTIGRQRHRAAERIDLLDQMSLADAADGRIAAHLPDGFDVVREQQRTCAGARRRERGFGAGVAATDHDHVELELLAHR